jgi:hypothetical protein
MVDDMGSGIGVRIFIFHDDGTVKRVSHRRFDAFHNENEIFPEYAGKNLRCAFVIVVLNNRKPVQIKAIDPIRLHFEADGSCNQVMLNRKKLLSQKSNSHAVKTGNSDVVIDLDVHTAQRQLERDFRWQPTKEDINTILSLLKINS